MGLAVCDPQSALHVDASPRLHLLVDASFGMIGRPATTLLLPSQRDIVEGERACLDLGRNWAEAQRWGLFDHQVFRVNGQSPTGVDASPSTHDLYDSVEFKQVHGDWENHFQLAWPCTPMLYSSNLHFRLGGLHFTKPNQDFINLYQHRVQRDTDHEAHRWVICPSTRHLIMSMLWHMKLLHHDTTNSYNLGQRSSMNEYPALFPKAGKAWPPGRSRIVLQRSSVSLPLETATLVMVEASVNLIQLISSYLYQLVHFGRGSDGEDTDCSNRRNSTLVNHLHTADSTIDSTWMITLLYSRIIFED